ncbi:MAG: protein-L-isoaspartate(D-aspartate) O-methyltransferase [Planctomycetota bacterium]|jgi:protein-L-isoaspartate(D-aspartate) O-methyltransferase
MISNDYDENIDLRRNMVAEQLAARDIYDQHVLETFIKVPREHFVFHEDMDLAFADHPLAIGENQTISQPYMVALMTQALQPDKGATVLEIGTGSGYQTAVLAELFKEVYTIERINVLADKAQQKLKILGYDNIHYLTGDGTLGWPGAIEFDRILVTAAGPVIPESLKNQLADNGIMVIPSGRQSFQELFRVKRCGNKFTEKVICGCVFVKLIGKEGY